MAKNLRVFSSYTEYQNAELVRPAVSYIEETESVYYDQVLPPVPKWFATYTGGTTESGACDGTSAITKNEITLTNLSTVEVEDCVISIGESAFSGETFANCTTLSAVTLSSGVTNIYRYSFSGCSNLQNINLDNVSYYGLSAFQGCTSISSLTFTSAVSHIGSNAFRDCSGLTSITFEGTTPPTVDAYAFENTNNCPIYVPYDSLSAYTEVLYLYRGRVTPTIGPDTPLKIKATYSDGTESSLVCDLNSTINDSVVEKLPEQQENTKYFTDIYIGDCVTTIDTSTLVQYASNITGINYTIGSGVTSMGEYGVFDALTLTIYATTPPTMGENEYLLVDGGVIYVPAESVNAYKAASGWSYFENQIQAIPVQTASIYATLNVGTSGKPHLILGSYDAISGISKIYVDGVELPNVTDEYTFSSTGSHSLEYVLADSTRVPVSMFNYLSCLRITLPSTIEVIEDGALYHGPSEALTVNATTPPTLGTDALWLYNDVHIYVPSASVSAYQSATGWSTYSSQIQAIPNS